MVFPLQCHTFANRRKCDFREIRQEMVEFQNYIKSSEMVVRGWYMTHFDRRDILNYKKIGLGWYCNYSDSYVLILRIFSIFYGNFVLSRKSSKTDFSNFRLRIFFSKMIFTKILNFW